MQGLRNSCKSLLRFQKQIASRAQLPLLNNVMFQRNNSPYPIASPFFQTFSPFSSQQKTDINAEGLNEIEGQLRQIKTENGKNILETGSIVSINVADGGKVIILLKLDQDFRKVKSLIQDNLVSVPWIKDLQVKLAPKDQEGKVEKRGGLKNIKKIIAVSSCKGGVGKSTVSVNLAFSLKKLGKSVGIFDADIYGPSLPTMISSENAILETYEDRPKEIIPIEFEGIKAMSFGFAVKGKKAVMRGPMVSSVVTQLATQTDWGELDYLIVDMPPGTGDIQITLCQELKFDGAVIVTTPQKLSFIDVVKGIEMFDDLRVPTIAAVENMAAFECDHCHHLHYPFGPGYLNMLQQQFGMKHSVAIPVYSEIAKYSDMGSPVVLTLPEEHPVVQLYNTLARNVDEEAEKLAATSQAPHVRYETGSQLVIVRTPDGKEKKIKALELRKSCNCALCVEEFSGKPLIKEGSIREDVYPYKIEPKGNYAVAVIWSDGHKSSIYPYERLLSSAIKEHKREPKQQE